MTWRPAPKTETLSALLKRVGPSLSLELVEQLESEGVSPAAARQRIARGARDFDVKKLAGIRFQHNSRFYYLDHQFGDARFWRAIERAFRRAGAAYSAAVVGLKARGGRVRQEHFAVVCGAPSSRKGQYAPEHLLERLKAIQMFEIEELGDDTWVKFKPFVYQCDPPEVARARLLAESIALEGVRGWMRTLGFTSYDQTRIRGEDPAPQVSSIAWDLSGPSYIRPMAQPLKGKLRPGFIVADLILRDLVDADTVAAIVRKHDMASALPAIPPIMPFLVADAFTREGHRLAKQKGLLPTTTAQLLGDIIARSLRELVDMLTNLGATAAVNPDHLEKLLRELTLLQWLRGLSVLGVLAEAGEAMPALGLVLVPEEALLDSLALGGLDPGAARAFVTAAAFGTKARDLFDAPLIRLQDGRLALFGPGLWGTNPGGVIRSIWEQHRTGFHAKGAAFENRVLDRLLTLGLTAFGYETRRDGEDFQYDAILAWGDHVFVFECKNRALAGDEPVQGRWFLDEVVKGVEQVKRLAAALPRFADALRALHGLDLSRKTIVPCLLNNLPFARPGRTDGCFVYDFNALDRFFSSRHLNLKVYQEIDGEVLEATIPVAAMWAGATPTPADLLAELEDPLVLRLMRHHARASTTEMGLDNAVMTLSPEFVLEPTTPQSFATAAGVPVAQVKFHLERARKRFKKLQSRVEAGRRP